MTPSELDSIVEAILKTNDAPADDQRPELIARLKELQDPPGGQSLSSELPRETQDLGQNVTECGRVQQYRLALSCLRSLPDEIWARIFEAGLTTWWSVNHTYLQTLEQVCRLWRFIALNHYPLWSLPPDIYLPDIFDPRPLHSQIQILERKLRIYLSRSGATPLSVKFTTSPEVWDDSDARALVKSKLLSLLVAQCPRWQSAELCMPVDVIDAVLQPVKSSIPLLRTLRLFVNPPSTPESRSQENINFQIDCFKDAQSLRHVNLTAPFSDPLLHVDLPWAQLETFEATTAGSYLFSVEDFTEDEPIQLLDLELHFHGSKHPFAFCPPVTLGNLQRLTVYANQQSLSSLEIFDLITLPALSNLTIKGEFSPLERSARSLCSKVLDFIKRSKCSLQHLSFEFPSDSRQEALYHILSLSPDLQHLEIPHLDSDGLRKLVLTPEGSPKGSSNSHSRHPNILPKLKVLKLCWYGDFDNPITDPPYFPLNETGVVDASALKDLVYSRTEALYGLESEGHRGEFRPLQEVDLRRYNTMKLESEWNKATDINVERISDTLTQEFEDNLRNIQYYGWTHPDDQAFQDEARANPEIHELLDSQMLKMESLDIQSYPDTFVLARRNIPHLLEEIRNMGPGRIPGDGILDLRGRAGRLSDKWRPFLLRDARKSWRYTANVAAQLICRSPFETHADQGKGLFSSNVLRLGNTKANHRHFFSLDQIWADIISYHP